MGRRPSNMAITTQTKTRKRILGDAFNAGVFGLLIKLLWSAVTKKKCIKEKEKKSQGKNNDRKLTRIH